MIHMIHIKIILYCNNELFNNNSASVVSKKNFNNKLIFSWSQFANFKNINNNIKCNNIIFLSVSSDEAIDVIDYSIYLLFQF